MVNCLRIFNNYDLYYGGVKIVDRVMVVVGYMFVEFSGKLINDFLDGFERR